MADGLLDAAVVQRDVGEHVAGVGGARTHSQRACRAPPLPRDLGGAPRQALCAPVVGDHPGAACGAGADSREQRMRPAVRQSHRTLGPRGRLVPDAPVGEVGQVGDESKGKVDIAGGGGPFERGPEVVEVGGEPFDPVGLIDSAEARSGLLGERGVVRRVPASHVLGCPAGLEPLPRVGAEGLQQPEAGRVADGLDHDHRLVSQVGDEVGDGQGVAVLGADFANRCDVETTREHRQPREQTPARLR